MEARYIDPRTGPKISQRLHVEIDLMADLIDAQ